jgi:hypothetical protein
MAFDGEQPGRPESGRLRRLRAAALIAVLAGGAGSFALMLRAGRYNPSIILVLLFTVWVLSPFVALALAGVVSKRWSTLTRAALYGVMFVVALGSLAIYGADALWHLKAQAAFVFLVVPLASWLLIAIVVPIAAFISRPRSRHGGDA